MTPGVRMAVAVGVAFQAASMVVAGQVLWFCWFGDAE
jgi:hypothetical protein